MTSVPAALSSSSCGDSSAPPEPREPGPGAAAPAITTYLDAVQTGTDAQDRLQHGLDLLPSLIPGCQHASVTTLLAYGLEVQAATDDTSRRADDLQRQLSEGPVLQAMRTGHSVIAHDLRSEIRWARWSSQAAAELGIGSALSILLLPGRRPAATLNLYSGSPSGLTNIDLALLQVLASPLSSIMTEARISSIRHP